MVASEVSQATGKAERDAALRMARALSGGPKKTLRADKGYHPLEFMANPRISGVMPHVAKNITRSGGSAIDGPTARNQGYAQTINARKRIEQVFGWIKQSTDLRQHEARGRLKVGAVFRLYVVAYNLIRSTNLLKAQEVIA